MYTEVVLLESRSARSGVTHRVEVLDKVKTLALSPDGVHATTKDVAAYFEVGEKAVNNLLGRHREELEENGLRVLRGSDLRSFEDFNLKSSNSSAESYPQPNRRTLALYTRRTVLNVAMLLRDSDVARRVRAYLLDAEEQGRSGPGLEVLTSRVGRIESALAGIGPALQELGPVMHRMSVRLERVDQRLEHMDQRIEEIDRRSANTDRVVGAMSHRLDELRTDLDRVAREVSEIRRRRR